MGKLVGWLIGIIVVLLIAVGVEYRQVQHANEKWSTAEANVKAYSNRLSTSEDKNTALQLTCGQLEYFNDSVLKALDQTRKDLKIKDKNLKALQAVSSGFGKRDTIRITQTDTLFREPTLAVDTMLGDKWYQLKLGLKYPSVIVVEPYFKSEKHIIVSSKKETVNPPKKFFLLRWFQKKHLVIHVDVKENNPYVDNESSEYVEIVK